LPNLPAPYVSPWKDLARNLRALWADLRLRVQELWRRNREGDLSVPGFWPSDLVPLFWPLLLAASLALLVSAGVQLNGMRVSSGATPVGDSVAEPAPIRELPAPLPLPPEQAEASVVIEAPPPPAALELDPLLDLFLDGSDPTGVLDAARPEPAVNRLVLQLSDAWWQLSDDQRTALAERWQQRSSELGYSDLQLVNAQDRLLGRSAQVGVGMILFNNDPSA